MTHKVNVRINLTSLGWWDNFTNSVYDDYERLQLHRSPGALWTEYLDSQSQLRINASVVALSGVSYELSFKSERDYILAKLKWA
jgi:hypothetical protein